MLGHLMEEKRLDFDAPLLSVRRFSTPGRESGTAAPKPPPRRSSLPFYKPELKSGPVGKPGIVPFVWEQTPGRPKDGPVPTSVRTRPPDRTPAVPRPPPGRISKDKDSEGSPGARIQESSPPSSDESKVRAQEGSSNDAKKGKEEVEEEQEEEKQEEEKPVYRDCGDDDNDDAFSDALDTLSRTESFFMNCSTSGLTGGPEITERSGSFAIDPQVRDFMMGRFLPAAQAMASNSPQCAPRKASAAARQSARPAERAANGEYRRPLPLPYQHKHNYVPQYAPELEVENSYDDDDEVEEEYHHSGHLASKACGLLPRFCLQSSLGLLNPVPGMKVPGRLPRPSRRTNNTVNKALHQSSLSQAGDEYSWEAVYKHKLGRGDPSQLEDGSKLMSESNQLTYWSDSPTADGSSPYRRSGGGISPYRNEASQSPFCEGKGFLGVPKIERKSSNDDGSDSCEKDHENYWEITPHSGSLKGSGSMSPAVERTLYVDSVLMSEPVHSKSSSLATMTDTKDSVNAFDKETRGGDPLQLKDFETVDPGLPFCSERSDHGEMCNNIGSKGDGSHDGPLPLKADDLAKSAANPLQPLLPPPLPKSPSESWLWRTLPSVSSKNLPAQSFLGIQFQSKRQALQTSATDSKQEANIKPSKPRRQIRFADVLTKSGSPKSEA